MASANDPHNSDAAYTHDDVDQEALKLAQFEQSEAAGNHGVGLAHAEPALVDTAAAREPGWVRADSDEQDEVTREDRFGVQERREPLATAGSALARHKDPSVAKDAGRARLERQVRDRAGVRWVPASELIRHGTARLAGRNMDLQSRAHRAVRDGIGRAVARSAIAARERAQRLGQARPLRTSPVQPATRGAAGL